MISDQKEAIFHRLVLIIKTDIKEGAMKRKFFFVLSIIIMMVIITNTQPAEAFPEKGKVAFTIRQVEKFFRRITEKGTPWMKKSLSLQLWPAARR